MLLKGVSCQKKNLKGPIANNMEEQSPEPI